MNKGWIWVLFVAVVWVPVTLRAQAPRLDDSQLPTYLVGGWVSVPDGFSPMGIWVELLDSGLYTVTDQEGGFDLSPLPSGEYELQLEREDLRVGRHSFVIERDDIQLTIPMVPRAVLTGIVQLDNPLADRAGTTISAADAPEVQTDTEGRYSLVLPEAGVATVRYSRDGYVAETVSLDVQGIRRYDVQLQQTGQCRLEGIVLGGTEPLSGALVVVDGIEVAQPSSAVTTDEGTFAFEGLPPGFYRVEISAPGWTSMTIDPVWLFEEFRLEVTLESTDFPNPPGCRQHPGQGGLGGWCSWPVWILATGIAWWVRTGRSKRATPREKPV